MFIPNAAFAKGKKSSSNNDGEVWVDSYKRKDGTEVDGHWRTKPDKDFDNNWSTKGNMNRIPEKREQNVLQMDAILSIILILLKLLLRKPKRKKILETKNAWYNKFDKEEIHYQKRQNQFQLDKVDILTIIIGVGILSATIYYYKN
jgi:hypothetical protein